MATIPRSESVEASRPGVTVADAQARWEASLEEDPGMRAELDQRLVDLLGNAADIQSVSPEMLLALLQTRMRDLDGQIGSIMLGLNERTQRAEQIGQRLSEMRNVQTFLQPHMNSDGNVRMDDPLDQEGFYALCRAAGLSDAEAQSAWAGLTGPSAGTTVRLDAAIDHVMPAAEGAAPMSARLATRQGIDNEVDNLNQDLQDCNRGNELLMIKLQTLMDLRKESITQFSNSASALHEMKMTPINNTRA